jgi:uncharacterized protein with PIN domain
VGRGEADPPRFLADAMLGRLARWLRVVGLDALYLPATTPDAALVVRAERDGRILLTRDRHLLRELRPRAALEIRTDVPLEQLAEVVRAYDLPPPRELLTRCLLCNTPLEPVTPTDAGPLLPPAARELSGSVRRCATCERIYWRGSHARRMQAALATALPGWMQTGT